MDDVQFGGACPCGYEYLLGYGHYGLLLDEPVVDKHDTCPQFGHVVSLPHPEEEETLAKYGFTGDTATLRGRIVYLEENFCAACGQPHISRSLSTFPTAIGLYAGAIIGALIGVAVGPSHWSTHSLIGGAVGWGLVLLLHDPLIRICYARRNKQLRAERVCPCCSASEIATKGVIPCPKCGERSMLIEAFAL